MRWKILKGSVLEIIGVAMGGAAVYRYQPVAVAWFLALYSIKELRLFTIPVSIGSLFLWMPYLDGVKYALVILLAAGVISLTERVLGRQVGEVVVFGAGAASMTAFEYGDLFMRRAQVTVSYLILPLALGICVFCLAVLLEKAASAVYQLAGKNQVFRNEQMLCLGVMLGLVCYGLASQRLWQIQLEEGFIYFVILYLSYQYGAGMGAIIGAACGVASVVAHGNTQILGVLCLSGIMAGAFRELGRLASLAGLVCSVAVTGIFYEPEILSVRWLISLSGAAAVFLLLPRGLICRSIQINGGSESLQRTIQIKRDERLKDIASSFDRLSKTFWKMPNKKNEMTFTEVSKLVEEVSRKVCTDCTRYEQCWKKGKYEAFKETSELFKNAASKGMAGARDVNRQFFNRCKNVNGLIAQVNHLYERQRVNMLWHNRLVDSKYAVATQLQEFSEIIEDYSQDHFDLVGLPADKEEWIQKKLKGRHFQMRRLTLMHNRRGKLEATVSLRSLKGVCISTKDIQAVLEDGIGKKLRLQGGGKQMIGPEYVTLNFVEDVNFKVLCGAAKVAKGKGLVSGDNFGFTSLNSGQMLMTISDGMGFGKYAYLESETVVELLEDLLESGFKNEVALKLINIVMMLNSDANDTATADLGILDLYTGICQFIKLGAAPTFIKRGSWVEVIKSTSLPLGVLDTVDAEKTTKKIYDGDMIVMVSDGVIDGLKMNDKEQELSDIIRCVDARNPKEFANELMKKVLKEKLNDVTDDMTILAGAVWTNR